MLPARPSPGLLLSVIVPVHNGEAFLAEALTSVLSQDAGPIEIAVIDDGSTDATPDVVSRFGTDVNYVRQKNAGPSAARNTGLRSTRGDIVGFLDADDLWPAGRVASQLRALTSDDRLGAVVGMTRCLYPDGRLDEPRFLMQMGCGLFRRSAFDLVGLFDPALRFSEDIDWYTRAREAGLAIQYEQEVVLHYRLHEHNLTRGTDVQALGYLPLVKRSLDRRRRQAGTGTAPPLPDIAGFDGQ
jgi:glycosyltransferase involved in cell wall biosynthesis